MAYSIGIDFGTNSVRAVVVDTQSGEEVGCGVYAYRAGEHGVVVSAREPDLARQHPRDYINGIRSSIRAALKQADAVKGFRRDRVIGLGVDTTGSTPLPVDAEGQPLALRPAFKDNPHAMAWLWKDHTAHTEAAEITAAAAKYKPAYLKKCGGIYSSEWFWAKILKCKRVAPEVFAAAVTWVELADWIPALLTGNTAPNALRRGICAAGHKAFFHPDWGGYPDPKFLRRIDPGLAAVRATLPDRAWNIADPAGTLTADWARALGLSAGLPVAVGAFDAHLGAVGAGIKPGTLVKIIGTSTCDITIAPLKKELPDIPGLCGIVPESVLPGQYGLEAGQSAVGDIFNWFVQRVQPGGGRPLTHKQLNEAAAQQEPGAHGLLALDWWNGNRTVLVDQRLTGLILGLNIQSTPADIYRALLESTAFGARMIVDRFEAYGVPIRRMVACGGIAKKSPLTMQIYANVLNRPVYVSRSAQTCALGAAMAGAVVAGRRAGGHTSFAAAARVMTGMDGVPYRPERRAVKVYAELFECYRQLHDYFGVPDAPPVAGAQVMKRLLNLRDRVQNGTR